VKAAVLLLTAFQAVLGTRAAGGEVQNLPLADRCEIAQWLSHYIVKAADFSNRPSFFSKGMRLFISADCRPASFGFPGESHANVSLFRKGETCGDLQAHRLDASEPMVSVTLATGTRDDLPADEIYVFVRTLTLGPRRWEFVWGWNDGLWSCPQGEKVRMCAGPFKWGEGVLPLLIVRMAKARGGKIEVESSALEFRRQVGQECSVGPRSPR
jgi:hypothetical protein